MEKDVINTIYRIRWKLVAGILVALVLGLLIMGLGVVHASSTTTVTIELKDSNGNPLSGGEAWYKGGPVSPGTWFKFGTTASDGKCSKDLASGYTYSFKVDYNMTTSQQDGITVGTDPITV